MWTPKLVRISTLLDGQVRASWFEECAIPISLYTTQITSLMDTEKWRVILSFY